MRRLLEFKIEYGMTNLAAALATQPDGYLDVDNVVIAGSAFSQCGKIYVPNE